MPALKPIIVDLPPDRRVAVAVELWDPIAQRAVSRGIKLTLAGREDKPIVSLSGRFVWIGRPDEWPPSLSVDPGREPFEAIAKRELEEPDEWPKVPPEKRFIRVRLTPTVAYPLQGEVTCIRGDLFRRDAADNRIPIAGADVGMQWWDRALNDWRLAGNTAQATTDESGNFVLFARIARAQNQEPDVAGGCLKVRLLVTSDGAQRATPVDQRFLPEPAQTGRIAEGGAREYWLSLDSASLVDPEDDPH